MVVHPDHFLHAAPNDSFYFVLFCLVWLPEGRDDELHSELIRRHSFPGSPDLPGNIKRDPRSYV
jgi:hypothetical protein